MLPILLKGIERIEIKGKKSSSDYEKLRLCSLCLVCDGNYSLETSTVMLFGSPDG